ncbi:unnamed protein product (macronuclear) [Paramecium tetraurelia]|uniref:C3H1-type domain-containing protein n=1 Tax=Paramecium tetraurelia TaxID=5888 RepID=A0C1N8_PARTE|nr:uncharacterized protein GSPATT00034182001 [Paramecium tetraurelia]CAK64705.1 unnamed protein product [Paramecium tetraurelia]|eukprot:XP_001432102.1 hypothetical protein (macronuclear) [Paramecium tetraurelia strain d4-2]
MQNSDNSDEQYSDDQQESPRFLYNFRELNLQNKSLLGEIRIICRNLIYVIGLAPTLAKEELLRKPEYFGQYGQIQKLIVIQSNTFNPPSHAAYITYRNEQEASMAILVSILQQLIGLLVKASFGTTKYCTNFLKGQQCKIKDCVYLHQHPKDKESTQVIKKEEMNNSKWLFSYSQRLAQINFKKFYTKINYKAALQKSIFLNTQNILDRMIAYKIVDRHLDQPHQQITNEDTSQQFSGKSVDAISPQKPLDMEKRLEDIIQKMDGDSNSRFKFTTTIKVPEDQEAINQLKQFILK